MFNVKHTEHRTPNTANSPCFTHLNFVYQTHKMTKQHLIIDYKFKFLFCSFRTHILVEHLNTFTHIGAVLANNQPASQSMFVCRLSLCMKYCYNRVTRHRHVIPTIICLKHSINISISNIRIILGNAHRTTFYSEIMQMHIGNHEICIKPL